MHPDFVSAVEMLPMPADARYDLSRFEGAACAWCGCRPSPVVKLGTRTSVVHGKLEVWHPVGCRRCVRLEAVRVYEVHVRACARCSHGEYCPDSLALHKLGQERA